MKWRDVVIKTHDGIEITVNRNSGGGVKTGRRWGDIVKALAGCNHRPNVFLPFDPEITNTRFFAGKHL